MTAATQPWRSRKGARLVTRTHAGAMWMRAAALTVGYCGRMAEALGVAYARGALGQGFVREGKRADVGEVLFAGRILSRHDDGQGDLVGFLIGRRVLVRPEEYRIVREAFGPFMHDGALAKASEVLWNERIERLDRTPLAWELLMQRIGALRWVPVSLL